MNDPEIRAKVEKRFDDFEWAGWATDLREMSVSEAASSGDVADAESWGKFQEAYDAMTTCVSRCKGLSRDLARTAGDRKSGTAKTLVADASSVVKDMEKQIGEFDVLMVADSETVKTQDLHNWAFLWLLVLVCCHNSPIVL